jgi:cytochrome c oxidase cbb3-type subunit 3
MRLGFLSLAFAVAFSASGSEAGTAFPRAERNYDTYCVQCHGSQRNGKGINAAQMAVQPRDHTDAKAMGDLPDAQIYKAIEEGGMAVNKSVLMPIWGKVLTDDEIHEMVSYLREVCKCGK